MKKLLFIFAALLPVLAWGEGGKCIVEGKIGAWDAPAKISLSYFYQGKTVQAGSAVLEGGRFSFAVPIDEPASASLTINYDNAPFLRSARNVKNFYIAPGQTVTLTSPDSLHHVSISGAINDQRAEYLRAVAPSPIELQGPIEAKRMAMPKEQRDAAFNQSLTDEYNTLLEGYRSRQLDYVRTHPDSYFSVLALQEVGGSKPDPKVIGAAFKSLSPAMQTTFEGQRLADRLRVAEQIASRRPAPDFTLTSSDGKQVSLSDYKGKYLLVDFTGSWCGSCRKAVPQIVEIWKKHESPKLAILSVFIEQRKQPDKWLQAIQEDKMQWTCVVDWQPEQAVAKAYGVMTVPRLILVDPQGIIINSDVKVPQLDAILAGLPLK